MIFIATSVVVYAATDKESLKEPCRRILDAVAAGRLAASTSVAVIEEILHLELRGRPRLDLGTARDAYQLFRPLLPVTDEIVGRALAADLPRLGSADRLHVATCLVNGIDAIVTADSGYDGLLHLRRIDPLAPAAVTALLS